MERDVLRGHEKHRGDTPRPLHADMWTDAHVTEPEQKETSEAPPRNTKAIYLIIIEDLECVIQDCLDHTDLPPGVGDVATGIGAH